MSAAEMCFSVLYKILELLLPSTDKQEQNLTIFSLLTDSLLATVFSSHLVQTLLSAPSPIDNLHCGSDTIVCEGATKRHKRRSRGGVTRLKDAGHSVEIVCIEGVGRLLSIALRCSEEFKRSNYFSSVFQGLLSRVQQWNAGEKDEDTGKGE